MTNWYSTQNTDMLPDFIEIAPGLFYCETDGSPWRANDPVRKGFYPVSKDKQGYYRVKVNGEKRSYGWHRLVWEHFNGPIPEGMEIDHRNNLRSDNRIANLSCVTKTQNVRKQLRHSNNTTGYPGVAFIKRLGKYIAQIQLAAGKRTHLGVFSDPKNAYAAYCDAKLKYHGVDVPNITGIPR